ncbi:ATP-binding protein [Candidatus Woesearchaeota archaeon]|nr:ATP-binding protein [Candidatus Woesearchaeota archaeon]
MYFDIQPKTEKEDLFGIETNLRLLVKALLDTSVRMMVIKGLRRTGKTSLLNVALKVSETNYVKIDVRDGPFYSREEFLIYVISRIRERVGESFIQKIIKRISSVALSYKDFTTTVFFSKKENISLFFENLNKELANGHKVLILALDEVQILKGIQFDYILASIFDNYKQIKLVLTGSEIGLLDVFLGKRDYDAPLFGRAYLEIESRRLNEEETTRFLEEGFKQIHKKIAFGEIREVRASLDGIIGWIAHYGWQRSQDLSHEKALEKVQEMGKEIVRKEFNTFLIRRRGKQKFLAIVKEIAKGNNVWSTIKLTLLKEKIKVTDSQLSFYLKELTNYGYIEKLDDRYYLCDPLMVKVAKSINY